MIIINFAFVDIILNQICYSNLLVFFDRPLNIADSVLFAFVAIRANAYKCLPNPKY
jgi:hypothetical protein